MLRCVGNRHSGFPGQFLHGPLALREQFQKFEAPPAGKPLADTGELLEELILEGSFR